MIVAWFKLKYLMTNVTHCPLSSCLYVTIIICMLTELQSLGIRIKTIRNKIGISQEELAFICGFDRTYISLLERGKRNPSYLNLLKLARGLNINVKDLIADV